LILHYYFINKYPEIKTNLTHHINRVGLTKRTAGLDEYLARNNP